MFRRYFHLSRICQQLTPHQINLVKGTAPVLANRGVDITTHFYKNMLNEHPELKNTFNCSNYDYIGRMDLDLINNKILLPNADYYLCGPLPFMGIQQEKLESMGISKYKIHSEVFGATIS
jgi:ferredoxin-NADP reductase